MATFGSSTRYDGSHLQNSLARFDSANHKHRTYVGYDRLLTVHVIPVLGSIPVQRLHRSQIKRFSLASKLVVVGPNSLTKNTVRNIHATLRAMLSCCG